MSAISFLKRILKIETADQEDILHGIDVLMRHFQADTPYDSGAASNAVIECKDIIRSDKAWPRKLRREMKWPPLDAAALVVMIYARRELESGQHHIYRGVLGGPGHGLKNVFEHALKRLVSGGRYSQSEAISLRKDVDQEIAEVG